MIFMTLSRNFRRNAILSLGGGLLISTAIAVVGIEYEGSASRMERRRDHQIESVFNSHLAAERLKYWRSVEGQNILNRAGEEASARVRAYKETADEIAKRNPNFPHAYAQSTPDYWRAEMDEAIEWERRLCAGLLEDTPETREDAELCETNPYN